MPAPLPRPNPCETQVWRDAYDVCLSLERRCEHVNTPPSNGAPRIVCARFLGYMILEAGDRGRHSFSSEILGCGDDDTLQELARLYITYFAHLFRARDRTPMHTPAPSRPSCNDTRELLVYLAKKTPQDYGAAKWKALVRDNFRCALTGKIEEICYRERLVLKEDVSADEYLDITATEAAYILPESITAEISDPSADNKITKHDWAPGPRVLLGRFGHPPTAEELNGSDSNHISNILTMDITKRAWFNSLKLWLEPTDVPDQYTPAAISSPYLSGVPPTITFTNAHPDEDLPLLDPRYLRLHAICCRMFCPWHWGVSKPVEQLGDVRRYYVVKIPYATRLIAFM
ncbi:hypothetical protein BOTBODRAFT_45982 [Botryobasidium botryosum FD-172 SS1]|uniref:HNH nuclease domain-containing protein n=1 Tax=Botryobasidium botryosum (strain FD-172 SS1) TaxID=930990 RepID=A0A067M8K2_BOTB1|nr:hypothetical protein BOTBODRAFT_45982 [Botryobasidium botryosum FD-172 SS1]